jgi:TonB family protein
VIRFDFDERYVFERTEPALPWVLRVLIADATFWVLFAFFVGPWIALIYLLWPRPVAPQQVAEDHTPIVFMQPAEIPRALLRPQPSVTPPPVPKPADHIVVPGNTKPYEAGDPPAPQPTTKAPEPTPPPEPPQPEAQIARNTATAPPVPPTTREDSTSAPVPGGLRRALQNLDRYASLSQSQANPLGGATDDPDPGFQFDPKGADFGPWIRRFISQVRRNWFVPLAAQSFKGRVVLQFVVHKDGRITDLRIARPSDIQAFTESSFNAIKASNPTQPLPAGYPDEACPFTVTFYYNEQPAN